MVKNYQFTAFKNHVMCRHEYNQIQANKIYDAFKDEISSDIRSVFEIEWQHFKMGELTVEDFGKIVKDFGIKIVRNDVSKL